MNEPSSFETFIQSLSENECEVEWFVHPDFGPDGMYGRREITFFLAGDPLPDSALHDTLKQYLIDLLNIPATSTRFLISGEGDITLEGNQLKIKYWWQKAIPFDHPSESYRGEGILTSLKNRLKPSRIPAKRTGIAGLNPRGLWDQKTERRHRPSIIDGTTAINTQVTPNRRSIFQLEKNRIPNHAQSQSQNPHTIPNKKSPNP
ncbi:hypothetical protein [Acanthopleuribacter pedis]|uniref:Uncharacterized protein n=1 Tax=Acanthopleuribacter pedis TaxID=442870 RepID=A0A8J7U1G3_9BACT|nr:hypothetical protein [Acanthopleuribacter pedis]MBO1317492.1 hypothetical protein [Acanthopleuribacter pedis]